LKHNILHCDIKSENVLIDKHGRVKLCDFGLAKIKEQKEQFLNERYYKKVREACHKNQKIHGTFGYLEPELLMKRSLNTEKSEI
jgi:serine/threonine protein kinase